MKLRLLVCSSPPVQAIDGSMDAPHSLDGVQDFPSPEGRVVGAGDAVSDDVDPLEGR